MIANYDKHRTIVWTPETIAAYYEMKLQISRCDTAPIIFCSDTSDYGIGGYLFQTIGGIVNLLHF